MSKYHLPFVNSNNIFLHILSKFPNTNMFIKSFIEQREYEENVFKINLSQGVTLVK